MSKSSDDLNNERILNHLKSLEERILRIESRLDLEPVHGILETATELQAPDITTETEDKLEFQLGQNWFAKAGIVVLAIGIAFLLTFPYQNLPAIVPSAFGYILVGGIFFLAHHWREPYQQISRYLLGGALLLLYFTTLRLSYFSPEPALTTKGLELALLLGVVVADLVISARKKSVFLVGLSLTMGYVTALVGGQAYFVFAVITAVSGVAVYFTLLFQRYSILVYAIILSYTTQLLWSFNNPFFGNPLQLVSGPPPALLFILLYALIFSAGSLLRGKDRPEDAPVILSAFLNGPGSYSLFLLLTLAVFRPEVTFWHSVASCFFLGLSIVFWLREKSRYATFIYAMLGYTALSVAIIAQSSMPKGLILLCWQCLLVITTAVWFRSRFIVVANFVIYLMVFFAYLATADTVSPMSVSFGIVALLSARVLNWQKDRLELKTEMMRNAYLVCALFFIPYALYHTVPSGYVSFSWLAVALFYYIASRFLKNRKYRWMALLTMSMTILYVFLIDLVGVDATFRIISFLVLGSALLGISMVYSRRRIAARSAEAKEKL